MADLDGSNGDRIGEISGELFHGLDASQFIKEARRTRNFGDVLSSLGDGINGLRDALSYLNLQGNGAKISADDARALLKLIPLLTDGPDKVNTQGLAGKTPKEAMRILKNATLSEVAFTVKIGTVYKVVFDPQNKELQEQSLIEIQSCFSPGGINRDVAEGYLNSKSIFFAVILDGEGKVFGRFTVGIGYATDGPFSENNRAVSILSKIHSNSNLGRYAHSVDEALGEFARHVGASATDTVLLNMRDIPRLYDDNIKEKIVGLIRNSSEEDIYAFIKTNGRLSRKDMDKAGELLKVMSELDFRLLHIEEAVGKDIRGVVSRVINKYEEPVALKILGAFEQIADRTKDAQTVKKTAMAIDGYEEYYAEHITEELAHIAWSIGDVQTVRKAATVMCKYAEGGGARGVANILGMIARDTNSAWAVKKAATIMSDQSIIEAVNKYERVVSWEIASELARIAHRTNDVQTVREVAGVISKCNIEAACAVAREFEHFAEEAQDAQTVKEVAEVVGRYGGNGASGIVKSLVFGVMEGKDVNEAAKIMLDQSIINVVNKYEGSAAARKISYELTRIALNTKDAQMVKEVARVVGRYEGDMAGEMVGNLAFISGYTNIDLKDLRRMGTERAKCALR